jgi:hypothetical protein
VSSVDTLYFVEHEEPLKVLAWVRESMAWPLGELLEGHEFLLILQVGRRSRSRSICLRRNASKAGSTSIAPVYATENTGRLGIGNLRMFF